MGASTDDFGKLKQLLKLKRFELPPPRFFRDFSSQVLTRLEQGERAADPGSFLGSWLSQFGLSPIPAFGCALIACGLLLYGVALSLRPPDSISEIPLDPSLAGQESLLGGTSPASLGGSAPQNSSSNPVLQSESFITPVRASFTPK